MRKALVILAVVAIAGAAAAQDLIITEFMYKDDNDGGDWIELYNRGASPIVLDGLHMVAGDPGQIAKMQDGACASAPISGGSCSRSRKMRCRSSSKLTKRTPISSSAPSAAGFNGADDPAMGLVVVDEEHTVGGFGQGVVLAIATATVPSLTADLLRVRRCRWGPHRCPPRPTSADGRYPDRQDT